MSENIFERAKPIALGLIKTWLPGGYIEGGQWVVKNPTRNDTKAGSFKVNLETGRWNDYADPDGAYGHDAISLYGYLSGLRNYDAAKEILEKYDPGYFPGEEEKEDRKISWYQLTRGCKETPELPKQSTETMRWPLEIHSGKSWRTVMMVVRTVYPDGSKIDLPWTLWTDGKIIEWRKTALHGVSYPLYGLRALTERPNAPFILYEGQKVPAIVQQVVGDEYACIGWYGGAGNTDLTDWSPLVGREGYFCFDADAPGRKAILKIIDKYHASCALVFPPHNVKKGWDHADAIRDGWTKDDIIRSLKGETTAVVPAFALDLPDDLVTEENRPTRLDISSTKDFNEYVWSSIYEQDRKTGEIDLNPNWFFWIVNNDPAIRNCIKYDYTTGIKVTAYESSEIFDANLEYRLANIGITANLVTKSIKERMCGEIIRQNNRYNRVADYMDMLDKRYPNVKETILDDFMNIFKFNIPREHEEDPDNYVRRCGKVEELYKELFHKFFVRMHARINGTRKDDDGAYLGLIQNDIVPILEGPQGIGKTTMCRWLACDDELYIDLGSGMKLGFGSSETVKKIRGRLLAEIGEMKIMKTPEALETIKSFISMKAATIEIKYVEAQRDTPMTCSFMGTDNEKQYLSDETGNVRFWPVSLSNIDKNYISRNKNLPRELHAYYTRLTRNMSLDQVFEMCLPSKELKEFMESVRKNAMITYSDYEVCINEIKIWLQNNSMAGGTLSQADIEKLASADGYPTRISQKSFKRAMTDAGFVQERRFDKTIGASLLVWAWAPKSEETTSEIVPF